MRAPLVLAALLAGTGVAAAQPIQLAPVPQQTYPPPGAVPNIVQPFTAQPLPPPPGASPQEPPPPGPGETAPAMPGGQSPEAQAPGQATAQPPGQPSGQAETGPQGPTPSPAAPAEQPWLPRGTAELIGLDKVDARVTHLTVPVGQSVTYGSLSITVRSCVVRPPGMPPDAAAFVEITDNRKNGSGAATASATTGGRPDFTGWLLEAEPYASIFQHPVYDIRLAGCR